MTKPPYAKLRWMGMRRKGVSLFSMSTFGRISVIVLAQGNIDVTRGHQRSNLANSHICLKFFSLSQNHRCSNGKIIDEEGSTHHLSSAIVLHKLMGPAARAKIRKSPGLRPLFSKAIHYAILLTVFVITFLFLTFFELLTVFVK